MTLQAILHSNRENFSQGLPRSSNQDRRNRRPQRMAAVPGMWSRLLRSKLRCDQTWRRLLRCNLATDACVFEQVSVRLHTAVFIADYLQVSTMNDNHIK
jgi:hypothetical protein